MTRHDKPCTHGDMIDVPALNNEQKAEAVCRACVEQGSTWVHLRECRTCGEVSCCDSSPNKHARKHARRENHPVITSAEPGEDWSYCYVDDATFAVESGEVVAKS